MGGRNRLFIALLISLVPCRIIRILLYRLVLRYQISLSARIGLGAILAVERASIGAAYIGAFNRLVGPFKLVVEDGAIISPFCTFECGDWVVPESQKRDVVLLPSCIIRRNARVTEGHFIDASCGFELGEHSWIAGRGSQFWTHGAEWALVYDRKVAIGDHCYVGSAVRFAPGARIGNHCIVGVGSVVTKRFDGDYLFVAGAPAEIVRENWDWIACRTRTEPSGECG
jgi:acetyltransferase-like isoleucine patch superfamily enzyme